MSQKSPRLGAFLSVALSTGCLLNNGFKWIIMYLWWGIVDKAVDKGITHPKIMLIGEFTHNIDVKKRVAIPAKFRKELGKKAVITRGFDNCLVVYPIKEWDKVAEKLSSLPMGQADNRNFARMFLAGAVDVSLDSLGRILIPDYLKKFAGLKDKVTVTGVYKKLEIWDETAWEKYKEKIEKQTDVLAEKLGEVGVY
ncbi:MAG: division/cell wall cluster transcriptional repressor MraZ [Patescibacteria group bacterium]